MAPTAVAVRSGSRRPHHHFADPRIEAGSLVAVGLALLAIGVCVRDAAGDATALAGLLVVAAAFVGIEFVARLRAELARPTARPSRVARVGSLLTFRRWP